MPEVVHRAVQRPPGLRHLRVGRVRFGLLRIELGLLSHPGRRRLLKNVAPSGRFHYAIINGVGAPNVTPDMCSIWFFVREGSPARAKVLYDKIVECGKAAAQASQTRLVHKFHSGTWNLLANKAGAELLNDNMRQIGAPRFTDADHTLAKAVQKSLGKPEVGMPTELTPLAPPAAAYTGGLATHTADISWQATTAVLLSAAYPPGT